MVFAFGRQDLFDPACQLAGQTRLAGYFQAPHVRTALAADLTALPKEK